MQDSKTSYLIIAKEKPKINKRKTRQAIFLSYALSRKKISQNSIAQKLGVTHQAVNSVIWGIRTSARIQQEIAKAIGFASWDDAMAYIPVFEAHFNEICKGGDL